MSELTADRSTLLLKTAGPIYLSFALMLCFYHAQTIDRPFWLERSEFHQGVISGDFKAPYQYRILSPWLTEVPARIVENVLDLPAGKQAAMARELFYSFQRLVATFLLFVVFHLYLERWFTWEIAFAGTLILAGIHLFTFRSYFFQPDSALHLLFLTIGAYLIAFGGRDAWLYPLTIIGSLNRETFGLIVPLYVSFCGLTKRAATHAMGLLLMWLAMQVALRAFFGFRPRFADRPMIDNLYESLWPLFLFSLMWLIPLVYFRKLPTALRAMLVLFAPPLIVANVVFGKVEETRLFLDLAIVLIPATLYVLLPETALNQRENSMLRTA